MDPVTILAAVTSAISIAKLFMDAGRDVAPILMQVYNLLIKGESVTQADLDALQAQNDAWSAELQTELPPEEP